VLWRAVLCCGWSVAVLTEVSCMTPCCVCDPQGHGSVLGFGVVTLGPLHKGLCYLFLVLLLFPLDSASAAVWCDRALSAWTWAWAAACIVISMILVWSGVCISLPHHSRLRVCIGT
jgi:hypothetical protein